MSKFEIIDLRAGMSQTPITVEAHTPEGAVETALGLQVVRSGAPAKLCARVYWTKPGQPKNMVRLYSDQLGRALQTAGSSADVDMTPG